MERLVEEFLPADLTRPQRRLYRSLLRTVRSLAADDTEVIDLKIADVAFAEMAEAFRVFRPFRQVHKVSMFGSARTEPDHPAYRCTRIWPPSSPMPAGWW